MSLLWCHTYIHTPYYYIFTMIQCVISDFIISPSTCVFPLGPCFISLFHCLLINTVMSYLLYTPVSCTFCITHSTVVFLCVSVDDNTSSAIITGMSTWYASNALNYFTFYRLPLTCFLVSFWHYSSQCCTVMHMPPSRHHHHHLHDDHKPSHAACLCLCRSRSPCAPHVPHISPQKF